MLWHKANPRIIFLMTPKKFKDIRDGFIEFMKQHGHTEIPESLLVPENDPSLLFNGAGMVPLVPYLIGEKHPAGTRLTDAQRCVRTGDIDEVGNHSHCTSFNMLGNWSLNDYFKNEAINLTVEFFVEVLGLDPGKLYASVFGGNSDAPRDEVSIKIWQDIFQKHGIEANVGEGERIQLYDKKNWWELEAGGPCGPCSEIFIDMGKKPCGPKCHINCNCGKYLEIGNNVFVEYLKKDGKYSPLGRHNVDFGGGLDRLATLAQGKDNFYETDIYLPILKKVQAMSKNENLRSQRIIVDHIKAATWMVMDGVTPGRTEQGYVLRRLIRRAVRHARTLGIEADITKEIGEIAITQFSPLYPQLNEKKEFILEVIAEEESKFKKTIQSGIKVFESLIAKKKQITGEDAFYLYETYGFPVEITQEMAEEKGAKLDLDAYKKAYTAHQDKSRSAAKGFFKGGLADTSDMSKKYHTATHLLLKALRMTLGDQVTQKGSNISPERLRFDFPSDNKLTPEEIQKVETIVNEQIKKGLEVYFEEMPKDKALEIVKGAAFGEKYGDTVKVYRIGRGKDEFSVEICGGPHVANTSELGTFKITKQENVGAGVKRIKATLS